MNWQVELHNYCNFECGYCPHKDMERRKEFMRDEVWTTILHKYIVPYKDRNSFCPPTFIGHKDTEPLIDRKLPSRLGDLAVACPDMKIDVYSNGVLLPAWAKRGEDFFEFLATLPNQVRYMMSYHPFNHDDSPNDYSDVVRYLRKILVRKADNGEFGNVEFITVSHKSKWVPPELQQGWRLLWQRLPITVHENCSINPWTGRMEDIATCHYNGCPYSDFGHWFFGVTGNIIACCLDLEEEIVIGNVLTDDPAEMFAKTEEFYAEQRRTLEQKLIPKHPVCHNCFGYKRNDGVGELIQVGAL